MRQFRDSALQPQEDGHRSWYWYSDLYSLHGVEIFMVCREMGVGGGDGGTQRFAHGDDASF